MLFKQNVMDQSCKSICKINNFNIYKYQKCNIKTQFDRKLNKNILPLYRWLFVFFLVMAGYKTLHNFITIPFLKACEMN